MQLPATIGQDVSDVEDAKKQWRKASAEQGGQKSQSHQQQPQQVFDGMIFIITYFQPEEYQSHKQQPQQVGDEQNINVSELEEKCSKVDPKMR